MSVGSAQRDRLQQRAWIFYGEKRIARGIPDFLKQAASSDCPLHCSELVAIIANAANSSPRAGLSFTHRRSGPSTHPPPSTNRPNRPNRRRRPIPRQTTRSSEEPVAPSQRPSLRNSSLAVARRDQRAPSDVFRAPSLVEFPGPKIIFQFPRSPTTRRAAAVALYRYLIRGDRWDRGEGP